MTAAEDDAALLCRLSAERERTVARVTALERDLEALLDATGDGPDDEHDPEGATIGFERAQVTALLADTRARLAELDEVVGRVATGAYGTCESCGRSIGVERLEVRPTARRCVDCAQRGDDRLR